MAVMGYYALFKKHINVGFDLFIGRLLVGKVVIFAKESTLKVVSASPSFLYSRIESLLNYYQFPASEIFLSLKPKEPPL